MAYRIYNHRQTRNCPCSLGNIMMLSGFGFTTEDAKLAEELRKYSGISVKEIVPDTGSLGIGALRKKVKELGLKQMFGMKKDDLIALIANA